MRDEKFPGGFGAFLIAVAAICGMLVSFLSLYEHLAIEIAPQIGVEVGTGLCKIAEGFDCKVVIGSKWSTIFGIPLGSYGLLFYAALLLLVLAALDNEPLSRLGLFDIVLVLSALATLYSIYLFIISKFVIGTLCPLCLATYAINIVLVLIAWVAGIGAGIGGRFVSGFGALLKAPRLLISGREDNIHGQAAMARVFLCAMVFTAAAVFFLPSYLINEVILERAQSKNSLENAQAAFDQWSKQMPQEIRGKPSEDPLGVWGEGPYDAPIVVTEFSDYECPACRAVHMQFKQLLTEYAGRVLFVHRNFPLDKACNPYIPQEFHKSACFAAEFARCAGEQGKFWEAHNWAFESDVIENGDWPDEVQHAAFSFADVLGLDQQAVKECLASGRQKEVIVADINEGDRLGLEGTPSFWINGRKVMQFSMEGFRLIFDEILAKQQGK